MAIRTDTPVDPFGATVDGVTALVPEVRLAEAPLPVGKYAVTVQQVRAWVEELSAAVAMRVDGWHRLAVEPDDGEQTSDRDQFLAFARTVVHNGVASYTEAARHPERPSAYAAVLWDRYTTGRDELVGWLTDRLATSTAGDTPEQPSVSGLAWSFPSPLIGDSLRF